MAGRPARGFTLLELLIVTIIVAVLAGTVVLSNVGGDRDKALETEAERLALLAELVRNEAVTGNREWGLVVEADGYAFLVYDHDSRRWNDEVERPFQSRALPEGVHATLTVDALDASGLGADAVRTSPDVLFLSSGEVTPFSVVLTPDWEGTAWRVRSDGFQRPEVERLEG